MHLGGLEPPAPAFGGLYSIRLSYRCLSYFQKWMGVWGQKAPKRTAPGYPGASSYGFSSLIHFFMYSRSSW